MSVYLIIQHNQIMIRTSWPMKVKENTPFVTVAKWVPQVGATSTLLKFLASSYQSFLVKLLCFCAATGSH